MIFIISIFLVSFTGGGDNDKGNISIEYKPEIEKTSVNIRCVGECMLIISVNSGLPYSDNIVIFKGQFLNSDIEVLGTYFFKLKESDGRVTNKRLRIDDDLE